MTSKLNIKSLPLVLQEILKTLKQEENVGSLIFWNITWFTLYHRCGQEFGHVFFPPGLWYDTAKFLNLQFCGTCGETTRNILYSTTVVLQTDKSTKLQNHF